MMRIVSVLLVILAVTGCKTKKKRLADQNNKMVAMHRAVFKARLATDFHKNDKIKYEEGVQALMKVLKKQQKALGRLEVDTKMQPVKDLLEKTMDEMVKGYRSVLAYLEKSKNLEAQQQIARVEKQFADRTLELRNLSKKIAKENNIKITEAPKEPVVVPKVAPPVMGRPPLKAAPTTETPPAADTRPAPAMVEMAPPSVMPAPPAAVMK